MLGYAQAGYDLVVHGLDAVFSIAADGSCHPHHKSGEAWKKKGDTSGRTGRQEGGKVIAWGLCMALGVLASRKMELRDLRRLHWGHTGCCWDMMWRRKYSTEYQRSMCPLFCSSASHGAVEGNG